MKNYTNTIFLLALGLCLLSCGKKKEQSQKHPAPVRSSTIVVF
jgi:hypothetical protein